jgi:hypothetical protein
VVGQLAGVSLAQPLVDFRNEAEPLDRFVDRCVLRKGV